MTIRMQQRRGTASQWTSANPVLNAGEIGWESDTNRFKIGNGSTAWTSLSYFDNVVGTEEASRDTVASIITSATHNGISVSYTDSGDSPGTLAFTNTGITSVSGTTGQISSSTTDGVATLSLPNAITIPGSLTLNADPTSALHAATKQYVDSVSAGLLAKPSVDVATTSNIVATYYNGTNGINSSLTIAATETLNIDGKTSWSLYDSVLFKDQTDKKQNGRYTLALVGDAETDWVFVRCGLCDEPNEIAGAYMFVLDGTVNGQTAWVLHVDNPDTFTVGVDNILVFQFSGPGTFTAGTGLSLNGTVFSINSTVVTESGTQTLTSKSLSLGSNTITGTVADFNSALTDDNFTTLTGVETLTNKTLTSPIISGLTLSDSSIIFEGVTANNFETTIQVTDPTNDNLITLPDASGTVALLSDIPSLSGYVTESGTQTLTNKTLTSPNVSNLNITDSSITFEGTPDDFETTLIATDATADRTITLPDVTGTVVTTGDTGSVTSTMILDGTIIDADINASAAIAQSKISGLTTDLGNKQDKVSGVSDTEIGYLDGVTSAIQTQIDGKLSLSGGTLTGALTLPGSPSQDLHAATKAYVDSVVEGLHVHESARAATTANIDLSTDLENGDTLDGVTLVTGDRVLVKNQSTESQNGIYVVQESGAAVRATDFDTAAEVDSGDFIFVQSGTLNAGSGWVQTNRPATIGTDAIAFTQFAGAGTFSAGNGLTLTGSTFSINTSITADLSSAQTLTNKTLTSPVINLGLNSQTGTSYTFTLADNGRFVTANNSSPITVTIPPSGDVNYPVGAQLNIVQKGTGQVTFAQGSGVTILSTGATSTAPKLRVRYSSATAIYEGSDTWYVVGDIS